MKNLLEVFGPDPLRWIFPLAPKHGFETVEHFYMDAKKLEPAYGLLYLASAHPNNEADDVVRLDGSAAASVLRTVFCCLPCGPCPLPWEWGNAHAHRRS